MNVATVSASDGTQSVPGGAPPGRMAMLRLHPLAQGEIEGQRPRFIERLFRAGFKTGVADRLGPVLTDRITAGGYPAAVARRSAARRRV